MLQLLKRLESEPVGISHLRRAAPDYVGIQLYDKLPIGGSIDKVFGRKRAVILFYSMHDKRGKELPKMGHYSCIVRRGKRVEYFSPYGYRPEFEIHATHSSGKLLALLGKNYVRSSAALQNRQQANTCARWALCRAIMCDTRLEVFVKLFSAKMHLSSPDDIVTLATLLSIL